ncbi:MAG: preprotein translocase subunit SecG [candidate division NC10 bacterium]|nr:preprotein translocase subunit SecG [candidate division NC10 bacterium]
MYLALAVFHLIVALALILIVLLQTGKGSDIGAAFGGGSSQTVFGGRGAATFLSKLTTAVAILFMLTSLTLAILAGTKGSSSVISEQRTGRQEMPAPSPPPEAGKPPSPSKPPGTK